jgi:glutamate-1-semialdehyde 2,1-aminomutase
VRLDMSRPERPEANEEWFARAMRVIPGGVNSPARSFKGIGGGTPPVMVRGQGPYLFDVNGRRYWDYQAAYGPLVLGHAHPAVTAAVQAQAAQGTLTGAPHPREIELAEELCRAVPGLDRVRLVTTGTEAVMAAVRLARAFTGRSLVVKFEGAYHGHSDAMLVDAGSGVGTVGLTTSGGIPPGVLQDIVVLPYNHEEPVRELFRRRGDEVAAVLVEPVEGNMGIVVPDRRFLETVRRLTADTGAVLIFDEVITAFRFHYGPVASLLGVVPDLYCLGKVIGGGLPAAAYGGRADIMDRLAPLGPAYQAGTLAGNPLSSAAGLALLRVLRETNPYPRMDELGARLEDGLTRQAQAAGIPVRVNRLGGMLTLFFADGPVTDYASAVASDAGRFAAFYREALARGVYLAPSRLECWFVSAVHTADDIEGTLEATAAAFEALAHERPDRP